MPPFFIKGKIIRKIQKNCTTSDLDTLESELKKGVKKKMQNEIKFYNENNCFLTRTDANGNPKFSELKGKTYKNRGWNEAHEREWISSVKAGCMAAMSPESKEIRTYSQTQAEDFGLYLMIDGRVADQNGYIIGNRRWQRMSSDIEEFHSLEPLKKIDVILTDYRNGSSYNEVASKYGLTREKVRYIVKKYTAEA
jgi:hypothetical protein